MNGQFDYKYTLNFAPLSRLTSSGFFLFVPEIPDCSTNFPEGGIHVVDKTDDCLGALT
jgi:hypothetical protein